MEIKESHDSWLGLSVPNGSFGIEVDRCNPNKVKLHVGPKVTRVQPQSTVYCFDSGVPEMTGSLASSTVGFCDVQIRPMVFTSSEPARIDIESIRTAMLDSHQRLLDLITLTAGPCIRQKLMTDPIYGRVMVMLLGLNDLAPAYEPPDEQRNNAITGQITMGAETDLASLTGRVYSAGEYEGNLFEVRFTVEQPALSPPWKTRALEVREALRKKVEASQAFGLATKSAVAQWVQALGTLAQSGQLDLQDPNLPVILQTISLGQGALASRKP
jgi:hypothetical protein